MSELKPIWVHTRDHKIFTEFKNGKDLKACAAFKKILKKIFPKKYEGE